MIWFQMQVACFLDGVRAKNVIVIGKRNGGEEQAEGVEKKGNENSGFNGSGLVF